MAATQKSTGAAAKSARQAKLSVVRDDEQPTEQQPTEQQPTTQTPATPADTSAASVADLQAQKRALDEQIKAAKSAQPAKQPKPEKPAKTLADVIEKQLARPRTDAPRILTTYVLQRQAAGQDMYEAVDQVLGQMRSIVLGAMESPQPGETYHQAIYRYLGRMDLAQQPAASDDTSEQ